MAHLVFGCVSGVFIVSYTPKGLQDSRDISDPTPASPSWDRFKVQGSGLGGTECESPEPYTGSHTLKLRSGVQE